MDIREYTSPTLPVAQFVERYVDTAHYDTGCRGCDNYGQVWVCPPYDFSVPDYWSGPSLVSASGWPWVCRCGT